MAPVIFILFSLWSTHLVASAVRVFGGWSGEERGEEKQEERARSPVPRGHRDPLPVEVAGSWRFCRSERHLSSPSPTPTRKGSEKPLFTSALEEACGQELHLDPRVPAPPGL